MPSLTQPNLSNGEISPSFYGRVDLQRYLTSLRTCKNFIPQAFGGVRNRQGTKFISTAISNLSAAKSRLVKFSFSAEQNYVLELTGQTGAAKSGTMRILSRGRLVGYSQSEVDRLAALPSPITVTKDTPVTVTTPWLNAHISGLKFSQSADVLTVTHPLYRPYQIKRLAHDRWQIEQMPFENGPWLAQNTDKAKKVGVSATTNIVTLSATSAIFDSNSVGRFMKIWQENFGEAWEANKEGITAGKIIRSDGKYYQAVNGGKTGTLRPTHDEGKWFDGIGTVEWEYLHSGFGVVEIQSVTDDKTAQAKVLTRLPDAIVGSLATVYTITNVSEGTAAGSYSLTNVTLSQTHDFGAAGTQVLGGVSFYVGYQDLVGGTYHASGFDVPATVVDTTTLALDYAYSNFSNNNYDAVLSGDLTAVGEQVSYKWAFSAWGGEQGWPGCSGYFQQRHCFAGTTEQPQTVWMSRTGNYKDFGDSTPTKDDDAIEFTLASAAIDGIKSLLPMDKLVMFTLGGNWVTGSGQDDVITPGNVAARLQNYYGASSLDPLSVGNTVLYHGRGGTVRDMSYDFASDTYAGNDLTVLAHHLIADYGIVDWSFQHSPFPIAWAVRSDGTLLSMTYLKEQQVVGWARHDLTGTVESVCVVNECGSDHVYLSVMRTVNGSAQRHLEVMYEWVSDEYEACFSDASVMYDGRNTSTTHTMTVSGGTLWTAAESVATPWTLTSSADLFVTGDVGDQIVLEGSDGNLYRLEIVTRSSLTVVTVNLTGSTSLHSSLRTTATSSWAFARDRFTGLAHLANTSVQVLADKNAAYDTAPSTKYVVSAGGVLTLDSPAFVVTCGLPITADLETLDLVVPGQEGPALENRKAIAKVSLYVEASRSCYAGPDTSNLRYQQIRDEDALNTVVTQHTGVLGINIPATWNRNGRVLVRHTEPYPLSILAVIPDVMMGRS